MAEKLIHLKDEKGKSFSVTPHAFENVIKKDKNWRKHYDYVGEIDAEAHAFKSESAMPYVKTTPASPAETKTEEVIQGTQEETTKEVFSDKKTDDNKEFINLETKTDEQKQEQKPGAETKSGNKGSGKGGSKTGSSGKGK